MLNAASADQDRHAQDRQGGGLECEPWIRDAMQSSDQNFQFSFRRHSRPTPGIAATFS